MSCCHDVIYQANASSVQYHYRLALFESTLYHSVCYYANKNKFAITQSRTKTVSYGRGGNGEKIMAYHKEGVKCVERTQKQGIDH